MIEELFSYTYEAVEFLFSLGAYSTPMDGCECVYLEKFGTVIKFILTGV